MTARTDDDLRHIAGAQELEIAPVRRNGQLRRATPIWVVRAGDDLYIAPPTAPQGLARRRSHQRPCADPSRDTLRLIPQEGG